MISDYYDFFIFIGGILILGAIIYLSPLRFPKDIVIPTPKISFPKIPIKVILLAIIIGAFLFNQFLMWKTGSFDILSKLFSISVNITKK